MPFFTNLKSEYSVELIGISFKWGSVRLSFAVALGKLASSACFRFRHTNQLVGVRKPSCFGFEYPVLSPQTRLGKRPDISLKIPSFGATSAARKQWFAGWQWSRRTVTPPPSSPPPDEKLSSCTSTNNPNCLFGGNVDACVKQQSWTWASSPSEAFAEAETL